MSAQVRVPIGVHDEGISGIRLDVIDGLVIFNLDAAEGIPSVWDDDMNPWRRLDPTEARRLAYVLIGLAAEAGSA